MTAEEVSRGVAVEKFDIMKKWGINTYKVVIISWPKVQAVPTRTAF